MNKAWNVWNFIIADLRARRALALRENVSEHRRRDIDK